MSPCWALLQLPTALAVYASRSTSAPPTMSDESGLLKVNAVPALTACNECHYGAVFLVDDH